MKMININALKQKLKNDSYRQAFEVLNREDVNMVAWAFFNRGFESGINAAGKLVPYLLASTESSHPDVILNDSPK